MQNRIVENDNYKLFCDQLKVVAKEYCEFKIVKPENEKWYLKGILKIRNDDKVTVGDFLIEIHFSPGFPFRFPKLYEVGGMIPDDVDWHKYKDGSCCITVSADEILQCRSGISVLSFIERFAVAYFANQIYRKLTGEYKNGEYAHGSEGVAQFYQTLFKTADTILWIEYLTEAFGQAKYPRNSGCFCGSGRKYKHCHLIVFEYMRVIGKEQIVKDLIPIIK
jgi:hypothetical protein